MSQRDVAFALELVARVLEQRWSTDPEDDENVTNYTLDSIAGEIRLMAETLKAAPVSDGFVWCEKYDERPCTYHPLGGPDCAL
jgi:hypothetical protein